MSPVQKQQKPVFKFVVTPTNIFMRASKPKRSTVAAIVLIVLLIVLLLIAAYEDGLRTKALEMVITIIEAIVTFFSANPKNK